MGNVANGYAKAWSRRVLCNLAEKIRLDPWLEVSQSYQVSKSLWELKNTGQRPAVLQNQNLQGWDLIYRQIKRYPALGILIRVLRTSAIGDGTLLRQAVMK